MRFTILIIVGIAMLVVRPVSAEDETCTVCRVAAVKRALRTNGTIDCAQGIRGTVADRVRRMLANCEQRHGCGSHESAVLAAIDDGVAAVEARICAPAPMPTATPTACTEEGCALRIRCLPDDQIEVLTPIVIAQPDGLHVEVLDPPPDAQVGLQALAYPEVSWWSGSSELSAPFIRPVPEGEAEVWCIVQPYQTIPDPSRRGSFTIIDPAEVFRSYGLECGASAEQHLDFGYGDASPSMDAAVREVLPGVLVTDTVEQAGYIPGDPEWPWLVARVVRAGSVIGRVDIDGREGWRYQATHARVCADSGLR
jgi:hypothetical protein